MCLSALLFFWGACFNLHAQEGPEIESRAAVVLDAETGTVVYAKNPDLPIPPASLTKLMTMHLVLEEIDKGAASADEVIVPPEQSWWNNQPPRSSVMFLGPGQKCTLRDLLLGLAIPSGTDAAVAVALRFTSSVDAFVRRMNEEAARLKLNATRFVEPSGVSEDNTTTARDFAFFSKFYVDRHPASLREYHSVPSFAYPRRENVSPARASRVDTHVQYNHNKLLGTVPGVDGLKTGYIDEAGYNISITAKRGETRFIAVVLGAPASPGGDRIRDRDGDKLVEWAFAGFKTVHPMLGDLSPARVWKGRQSTVARVPSGRVSFTAERNRGEKLSWRIEESETDLVAPLPAGSPAGTLVFFDESGDLHKVSLVTFVPVKEGNIFKRIFDGVRLFFKNL